MSVETASSNETFDMERWKGKVALVTGASEGIGAAICKELAKYGMKVVGCARHIQGIQQLAEEATAAQYSGTITPIACDLTDEASIQAMYRQIEAEFEHLDVCINNAISCIDSSLMTGDPNDWRSMLKVNVLGLCMNTKEAIRLMKEPEDAQIIHIGSIDGHRIPPLRKIQEGTTPPWFHVYFGTKFMTRALAIGLRQEFSESFGLEKAESKANIRVSTISPGPVKTNSLARSTTAEDANLFFEMYRCLDPEDVAGAVTYVLSNPKHVNVNDVILAPRAFNL